MLDRLPYVGLRPYHTDENLLFFGREQQIDELLDRLYTNHFVAVVGSSGCGKSSLLRAGLIPALKAGFLVSGSNEWMVAIMKPGNDPLKNLMTSLNNALGLKLSDKDQNDLIVSILKYGADTIIELIAPLREEKKLNFFLLVDQFEELFAFVKRKPKKKNEAVTFVKLILELAQQSQIPFFVVMTMRSDFIGDCSEYHGLPETLNTSQYLVPRLKRSQLKQVIEGPAKLYNVGFKPHLTSVLLNQLGQAQDLLPVLQHTLLRMWKNRDKKEEIDFDDYDAVKGLSGALSDDANMAYKSLNKKDQKPPNEDQQLAKKIFQVLTTVDSNGRKTRKPTSLKRLVEICGASEKAVVKILKTFITNDRNFLIYDPEGGQDQVIDISHEALIRQWKALRDWVDDEAKDKDEYRRLSRLQKSHSSGNKELLMGVEYEKLQEWFDSAKPNKIWASQYDDNFDESKNYLEQSAKFDVKRKQRKKWTRILIIVLPVIFYLIYSQYKIYSLKNELWKETQLVDSVESYNTFLNTYPEGKFANYANDSIRIKSIREDRIFWSAVLKINTVESYQEYIDLAIDSSETRQEGDSTKIINHISPYVKYIENAKRKINELEEGDGKDPDYESFQLAKSINTVDSYFDYYINSNSPVYKEQALDQLNNITRRGWLFCGRAYNANQNISERVFNLFYRKDAPNIEPNEMLKVGDVIKLRGISHRRIYKNSQTTIRSGDLVRDNTFYMVNAIQFEGNAVYVQIKY